MDEELFPSVGVYGERDQLVLGRKRGDVEIERVESLDDGRFRW